MHAPNYQTSFRNATPHQRTGAKWVAQSNVNKLMNHTTINTGTGESRTSVLLRKGSARKDQQSDREVVEVRWAYHCSRGT